MQNERNYGYNGLLVWKTKVLLKAFRYCSFETSKIFSFAINFLKSNPEFLSQFSSLTISFAANSDNSIFAITYPKKDFS